MSNLEKEYHIISEPDRGWIIKKSGFKKRLSSFKTKQEAISEARRIAKKNKGVVVIHKKDGTIQKKIMLSSKNESNNKKSSDIERTFGSAKGKVHMVKDFDATYHY